MTRPRTVVKLPYCFYAQYCLEEVDTDIFRVTKIGDEKADGFWNVNNQAFIDRVFGRGAIIAGKRISARTINATLREIGEDVVTLHQIREVTLNRRSSPNRSAMITKLRRQREREIAQKFDNVVTGIDNTYWKDKDTVSIYYNLTSRTKKQWSTFARANASRLVEEAISYIKENEQVFSRIVNIDDYKPEYMQILPCAQLEIRFRKKPIGKKMAEASVSNK